MTFERKKKKKKAEGISYLNIFSQIKKKMLISLGPLNRNRYKEGRYS